MHLVRDLPEFLDNKSRNTYMESGMNSKWSEMSIKWDLLPNLLVHYCLFEINHILALFGHQWKTELK